jgi:flagellar hook assembly protein FlgD
MPKSYALSQNYPNPFNASTEIRYRIPQDNYVTLKVLNSLGQEVRILVDAQHKAGEYLANWDGRDDEGREVASGIYFCWLEAGAYSKTVKMVHLK